MLFSGIVIGTGSSQEAFSLLFSGIIIIIQDAGVSMSFYLIFLWKQEELGLILSGIIIIEQVPAWKLLVCSIQFISRTRMLLLFKGIINEENIF